MNNETPLVRLEWDQAKKLVNQAQIIAVITHVRPDGDAVGSLAGLSLALKEQGKKVIPVVDGGRPSRFSFVPGSEYITSENDLNGKKPDLIFSTDASDLERLGKAGEILRKLENVPLIQLDHHQTNLMFGDVQLVDARTVAASEGILDLLDEFGWSVSQNVAQALLTGIVTDTLCFRTNNVNATTFSKVSQLMEYGANLSEIVQRTLAKQPTNLIRLYGSVLPRMELDSGVIWVSITREDYRAVNMEQGEYHGLAGYLIQSDDAVISAVFKEVDDSQVEVSLRAVPGFDVSKIALSLGGGGHVLASGCTIKNASLEEAIGTVIPLLKKEAELGERVYS